MTPSSPSVLHVNDCASTAAQLIAEAARRGHRWDYLPLASSSITAKGPRGLAQRAVGGAAWLGRLSRGARQHDITHVHSAGILRHARYGVRRYVLHCHGTDVRTQQYLPAWRSAVRNGLERADAVFFSTPDLAEHVLPRRADAIYLPVPLDISLLPPWHPTAPRVVFASRWGADKGGSTQVEVARAVAAAVSDSAEVLGLDWGPLADEARSAGVRLLEPMPRPDYLALLAGASVVVGQNAGILAASELEALGIGAPVVIPAELPLYADDPPPVVSCSPAEVGDVVASLLVATNAHDPRAGRSYVARVHGVEQSFDRVLNTYAAVLSDR